MKVHILGFEWLTAEGVPLADLFAQLKAIHHQQVEFEGLDRVLCVDEIEDFHCGLFVTTRKQSKSPLISIVDGVPKITVTQHGDNLIDFNFFLVHKQTGRGLYQHYHQSPGLNGFTSFCKRIHNERRDSLLKAMTDKEPSATQKRLREIRRPFRRTLRAKYLLTKDQASVVAAQFAKVRAFTFDYTTIVPNNTDFSPLQKFAKREKHEISFVDVTTSNSVTGTVSNVVSSIYQCVLAAGLTKGRIHGRDSDGKTITVDLFEKPYTLDEFDYDEAVTDEALDVSNVANSSMIQRMLGVAKANQVLLTAPVENPNEE